MCDQQSPRSACAYAQSDQSICLSLGYSLSVTLLTEHNLGFLSLKGAAQARMCLHMSKYHIVGNPMSRLIFACILNYAILNGNALKQYKQNEYAPIKDSDQPGR